ncbi:MAG: hypothetical protein GXP05_16930 [Alphaproteobacteria bacterium]|nr:hypothetical protein [Alphaproteobacteria bacterium]
MTLLFTGLFTGVFAGSRARIQGVGRVSSRLTSASNKSRIRGVILICDRLTPICRSDEQAFGKQVLRCTGGWLAKVSAKVLNGVIIMRYGMAQLAQPGVMRAFSSRQWESERET